MEEAGGNLASEERQDEVRLENEVARGDEWRSEVRIQDNG